ncbi:hypothetical protein JCM10212_005934 [Sporobolomyces blumeae]
MQPLDALAGSPPPASPSTSGNKIPPPPSVSAFATRPSPVVPPSPSVAPSPHHHYPSSRPTSPRPSRHASEEPASPTREGRAGPSASSGLNMLGDGPVAAGMGRSSSQVDLSHIFERDVEFASSHLITPSEAVDVAVPPVLTEAALALSASDDPVVSHDLETLIHESEADAQAGSGWSSPVIAPAYGLHQHHHHGSHSSHPQPHPLSQTHPAPSSTTISPSSYQNASRSPVRSSHARSFSPDSVDGVEALSSGGEDRRATSPGGSSTTFSGSPPTSTGEISPPATSAGGSSAFGLGPFGKKLAEALENEANKLPAGLVGTTAIVSPSLTARANEYPTKDAPASPRPGASSSSSPVATPLRPSNLLSPLNLSVPFPGTTSPSIGSDAALSVGSASPAPSPSTEPLVNPLTQNLVAPHPRRLSFISYADVINEERMAELTGEGGAATGTVTPAAGAKKGGVGADVVEGRLAGLLLGE